MEKVQLKIDKVSLQNSEFLTFALMLKEIDGKRKITFIMGFHDAQSIGLHLEKIAHNTPTMHEFFNRFASDFGLEIRRIEIYNKEENAPFASRLIAINSTDENRSEITFEIGVIDAIAIAIRLENCPIYINSDILDRFNASSPPSFHRMDNAEKPILLHPFNLKELEKMLQKAIKAEDYEQASRLRDEINDRKTSNNKE